MQLVELEVAMMNINSHEEAMHNFEDSHRRSPRSPLGTRSKLSAESASCSDFTEDQYKSDALSSYGVFVLIPIQKIKKTEKQRKVRETRS